MLPSIATNETGAPAAGQTARPQERTAETDIHTGSEPRLGALARHGATMKHRTAKLSEFAFRGLAAAAAGSILALAAVYVVLLAANSWESIRRFGWNFVTGTVWDPILDVYGALPFIFGTVVSSLVALTLAVPLGIGVATYLSEIAPPRLRRIVEFFLDVLAAIPSVVYGLWGVFALIPFVRDHVQPLLQKTLGFLPLFQGPPFGYGMLTAGIILAVMILPIVTSLTREALDAVPDSQREAAYALGFTRWETIRYAVLPYNKSGIIAAVVLGLGRALGETMAVTMVIGNVPLISPSLFMPGQTIASLLANEFAEASGGLYLSVLIELGLLLFGITLVLNVITRLLVALASRRGATRRTARPEMLPRQQERAALHSTTARRPAPRHPRREAHADMKAATVRRAADERRLTDERRATAECNMSDARFMRLYRRRRMQDKVMTAVIVLAVVLAVIPLVSIIGYVTVRGAGSVNLDFLTKTPAPVGAAGGGMANSIVGSGIVVGLASLLGIPVGVLAGIYLAEYGRASRLGQAVRFMADVLQGIPSIVVGIIAFTVVVLPMQTFSALAGAVALSMMLVPFAARTTEEALLTVSDDIREAGMALGQPRRRVILGVVLNASRGPLVTGLMLGVARIAGETAPLLFTALNNRFWHQGLLEPISTLTVQLYTYAIAPFDDWNRQAWAGAFVLLALILLFNVIARTAARSKYVERG